MLGWGKALSLKGLKAERLEPQEGYRKVSYLTVDE